MMILCISVYVNCIDNVEPHNETVSQRPNGFIQRNGNRFFLNGKPHYFNGFNAYWLMSFAADPSTSSKVTTAFQEASKYGLNLARAFAFNDGGGYKALQTSPGIYDESVFRVYYILSFLPLCFSHAHMLPHLSLLFKFLFVKWYCRRWML